MKKLFVVLGLTVILISSSCKDICKQDSTAPDLFFEVVTLTVEAFSPGSGQTVEVISDIFNQGLEAVCSVLDADTTTREVKMFYRQNGNDDYEPVVFAVEGTTDTTSSNKLHIGTDALGQDKGRTETDRFGFATNGQYAIEEFLDIHDSEAERNENNNGSGRVEGARMDNSYSLTFEITGAQERTVGQPVIVNYLGSSSKEK